MAAGRRKKVTKSRGASRGKKQGTPGWMWLAAGLLIGLGLAWYLFAKGYIPQPTAEEVATQAAETQPEDGEELAPAPKEVKKSQYDFFTVLPEMEVVVGNEELMEKSQRQEQEQEQTPAQPQAATETEAAQPGADTDQYLLQVGSFRTAPDAEQMKARLALLGITARVQTVTVNGATWHRVRVGPVNGARAAESMRSRLAANNIDSLVMKSP